MTKMLLTRTAAGMLAVPTGLVVAQEQGAEPLGSEATVLVAEQDRDQVRDRDGTCEVDRDVLQLREHARAHVEDGSDHGAQAREHAQARVADGAHEASGEASCGGACDGNALRIQERDRITDAVGG